MSLFFGILINSWTQMRQAFPITKICYAAGKCKDNLKSSAEDCFGWLVDVQDACMSETKNKNKKIFSLPRDKAVASCKKCF
jgi:hypothetical protein